MRTIIYTALLLSCVALQAQKDDAAKPYLEKIAGDLDPGYAINITFEYIREDQQDGSTIEGEGTLVMMGDKYKTALENAVIWFDGQKQYSLQTEIEEVYISVPDTGNNEFMFSDPVRLLRNFEKEFKYRYMGKNSIKGIPAEEIQLYPEELGGPYALIKLFFSPAKSELKAIVIRHKQGILYTMIVKDLERMDDPDDTFFRFNKNDYPNVDVIELL
jgi:outer membrane lipoprotein-sorting protein